MEKSIYQFMEETAEKHLKKIGTYNYEIKFNEYKKIQIEQKKGIVIKRALLFIGNNSLLKFFNKKLPNKTFADAIKDAVFEQPENFAKILNEFLDKEWTFDDYLEEYTMEELEILTMCLIKVNGGVFLLKKILKAVENQQANLGNSMVTLVKTIFELGEEPM